jgi:hypothetical protein
MNVRLKLRESRGLVTPRGPRAMRTIRSEIAGSELSFTVPQHRPWNRNNDATFPDPSYSKERLHLFSNYNDQDEAAGRKNIFRSREIFSHAWAYYGPWFTGVLSELRSSVYLYRPINYPQKFSLFHPRALELVIGDYLDYLYSDHLVQTRGHIQEFIAPIGWTPLHNLPVNAVKFEVKNQEFLRGRTDRILVVFPLLDDLMVVMHFNASCLKNLPKAEINKLINPQPMHDTINNIINSIHLKLSPEAQAQQAKALEGLADTSLVKHFPPIKWDKLDEQTTQAILLAAQKERS